MNTVLGVAGALGGLAAFIAGVWAIVRGIFRQTEATRDAAKAIRELSEQVDGITNTLSSHSARILDLERRGGRRW